MTVDMFYPVTDWDAPQEIIDIFRQSDMAMDTLPSTDGCPTVFPWFSPDL